MSMTRMPVPESWALTAVGCSPTRILGFAIEPDVRNHVAYRIQPLLLLSWSSASKTSSPHCDERGQSDQVWETVVDKGEAESVKEAKEHAGSHAGILVVKCEGKSAVVEEGDPIIVFQSGRIGDFD